MTWADVLYLHHAVLVVVLFASSAATLAGLRQLTRSPHKGPHLASSAVFGTIVVASALGWVAGDAWSNQRGVERSLKRIAAVVPASAHRVWRREGPNYVVERLNIPGSADAVSSEIAASFREQLAGHVRQVSANEWQVGFHGGRPCPGYQGSLTLSARGATTVVDLGAYCID